MGKCMTQFVNKLMANCDLDDNEMTELLKFRNKETTDYIFEKARDVKEKYYDRNIYIQGTIELTNYCKNNCYYCGLRRDNIFIPRYRLDELDVMNCCSEGYDKGVRSFMLVGGDDYYFTENRIADLIKMIKKKYPDCSVGLALGERQESAYKTWFEAGASRYILCHETANDNHFKKIHPAEMSLLRRKQSLWELKNIGYEVGSGFMVGTPYQMVNDVVDDLKFLKQLNPQVIHIVPFIPTSHTRFEKERSGNGEMTLYLMAIIRLMLPRAIIVADPALENVMADARKKSLSSGVTDVYASLCGDDVKSYFNVYNKKITLKKCSGDDVGRVSDKIIESGNVVSEECSRYSCPPKVEKVYGKVHRIVR